MSVPYDPENRFLRCAYEHKYGTRGIPTLSDDRLSQFVKEERSPRKQSVEDWFQERRTLTPSSPTSPSSITYLSKQSPTQSPIQSKPSLHTPPSPLSSSLSPIPLRMTKVKRGLSLEEDFPLLNGIAVTPKKPTQLPDTEERVIMKELPLPEPEYILYNAKGIVKMIYDKDNPEYVPEKKYSTIIEKAKSGSWSQRLKDSLVSQNDEKTSDYNL